MSKLHFFVNIEKMYVCDSIQNTMKLEVAKANIHSPESNQTCQLKMFLKLIYNKLLQETSIHFFNRKTRSTILLE